jgi:hypothetical protein
MAVKERTSSGKDEAYRYSHGVKNDLYEGRTTDADLDYCDGMCLGEREEWNLAKVARRAKWHSNGDD